MKDFEMTEEQLETLLGTFNPVSVACSPEDSQAFKPLHEKADDTLRKLGVELGFDYTTVVFSVEGNRFFSAEPI